MNQWKGINKRADDAAIQEGESPDASNAFFAKNTLGLLGPRKGKRFIAQPAWGRNITGLIPYIPGNGTRRVIVGTADGSLVDWDGESAVTTQLYVTGGSTKAITGCSLTLTAPSTTTSGTFTFDDASTITPDKAMLAALESFSEGFSFQIERAFYLAWVYDIGLIVDGAPVYLESRLAAWSDTGTDDYDIRVTQNYPSYALPLPATGNITGVALRLTLRGSWPSSMTSATINMQCTGLT